MRLLMPLFSAVLLACGSTPPTPEPQPAPEAPTPVVTPESAPEPEPEPKPPWPEGIVPQVDGDTMELMAARTSQSYLTNVDACVANPEDDVCANQIGVVGFHPDGRIARSEVKGVGGCGDTQYPEPTLRVAKNAVSGGTTTKLGTGKAPDVKGWAAIAKLAKAGFVPATDLRQQVALVQSGITSYKAVAVLGAPLAGWMVYGTHDGANTISVRLIGPDNKVEHVLESKQIKPTCKAGDADCRERVNVGIEQVVVSPDNKSLMVTYTLGDGGHCGVSPMTIIRVPVPAGIL